MKYCSSSTMSGGTNLPISFLMESRSTTLLSSFKVVETIWRKGKGMNTYFRQLRRNQKKKQKLRMVNSLSRQAILTQLLWAISCKFTKGNLKDAWFFAHFAGSCAMLTIGEPVAQLSTSAWQGTSFLGSEAAKLMWSTVLSPRAVMSCPTLTR